MLPWVASLLLAAFLEFGFDSGSRPISESSRASSQTEALAGGMEILVGGGGLTVTPVDLAADDFVAPPPVAAPPDVPDVPTDASEDAPVPPDEERPADVCGPDVTEAYVVALQRAHERLSQLGDEERGAWDGAHFLRRNGANIDVVARAVVEEGVGGGGRICPRGACERTVTLAGYCLSSHIANDIMYGFAVEMLDVPWAIALGGGHAWDLLQYGGLDPNTSKAAYTAGSNMAHWMNQGRPFSAPAFKRILETSTIVEGGFFGAETITLVDLVRRDEGRVLRCAPCPEDCTSDLTKDFSRMTWSLSDGKTSPYEEPEPAQEPAEPAPSEEAEGLPADDGKECGTGARRFGLCSPGNGTAGDEGAVVRTVDAGANPDAFGGPSGAGGANAPVEIVIQGRGTASGEDVFDITVVPGAPVTGPLRLVLPPGTKLVPVENPDTQTVERVREILSRDGRAGPGGSGVRAIVYRTTLPAYCLDRERAPPGDGMLYRIAPSPDEQEETAVWFSSLLAASLELREAGALRPDSDPDDYYHSILQWVVWVYRERMDSTAFEAALIEHTRRNFAAADQPWGEDVKGAVRALVPNRWADIQRIVQRAEAY